MSLEQPHVIVLNVNVLVANSRYPPGQMGLHHIWLGTMTRVCCDPLSLETTVQQWADC
jgi:hypothetical protein